MAYVVHVHTCYLLDVSDFIRSDCVCVIVSSGAPEWAEHINDTEKDVGSELTLRCCCCGEAYTMDTLAEGRLFGEYCFKSVEENPYENLRLFYIK